MATEVELDVDERLPRRRPELFEPGYLHLHERLEGEVGQSGAAPEPEGLAQELRAPLRIPALRRLRHEALETMQVDLLGPDFQDVAGGLGAHELATQRLAEI